MSKRQIKPTAPVDEKEALLARIDAIIRELKDLRRLVVQQSPAPAPHLTERLFGALGQGTWDEYDLDIGINHPLACF